MGLRGSEWCLMPTVIKSLSPAWDAVPNTAAAGFPAEPCTAPLLQARAHSEAPHTASRLPHLQTGCRSQQPPPPCSRPGDSPMAQVPALERTREGGRSSGTHRPGDGRPRAHSGHPEPLRSQLCAPSRALSPTLSPTLQVLHICQASFPRYLMSIFK